MLLLDDSGLSLTDGKISLQADLTSMLPRLKKNNLEREFLVKVSRIKGMNAADRQLESCGRYGGIRRGLSAACGSRI